jgi:uncharacterized membrane protein
MMTLDPLLDAPANIKLHVAAIAVALVLAPAQTGAPHGASSAGRLDLGRRHVARLP